MFLENSDRLLEYRSRLSDWRHQAVIALTWVCFYINNFSKQQNIMMMMTILYCNQRLSLLMNLFNGEYFQFNRILIKHWGKNNKTQTKKTNSAGKWKWSILDAAIKSWLLIIVKTNKRPFVCAGGSPFFDFVLPHTSKLQSIRNVSTNNRFESKLFIVTIGHVDVFSVTNLIFCHVR